MRVAVNAVGMEPWHGGGEEAYLRRAMKEVSDLHAGVEPVFLTDPKNDESFNTFETHVVKSLSRVPKAVAACGADLLYTPFDSVPSDSPRPVVLNVMSLFELRQKTQKKRLFGGGQARGLIEHARRVSQVVVPSEFMRKEVLDVLGIPLNEVVVAPFGVDNTFAESQHCIIEPPFLLSVARMMPRKNLEFALKVFQRLDEEIPHNFVIVGQPTKDEPKTWGPRTIRIDRLGTTQLAGLMQGCDLLLVPSLYEGSGVLVQEAMKAGSLVACSRVGGIADVAQNVPFYIDPENPDTLLQAIRRAVLGNEVDRDRRRTLGRQITVELTWERCAKQILVAFRRAVSG